MDSSAKLYSPAAAPDGLQAIQRVLLVDDSVAFLRLNTLVLQKWGLEVLTAENGVEALGIVERQRPDLVLSDWVMPGMDGLELCQRLRALDLDTYIYFILLTSNSEKAEVAQGLDAGADDFLTKPVDRNELRARMRVGDRMLALSRDLQDKNRQISDTLSELQVAHNAIDSDLQQARKIQQSLVPEREGIFGTSRVSLLLHPCGHVGGDLVGMFSPGYGRMGFYNIDVSGHGITSAMVTARVAGYLSSRFPDQNVALERCFEKFFRMRPPAVTADMLNQRLCADPGVEEYLTLAYAIVDLDSNNVRLVQAGHPPPIVLSTEGETRFVGEGGLPVGLIEQAAYDETSLNLHKGDRLLMYSDGFSEAVLKSGDMLGEDGVADLFRTSARLSEGSELLQDMYWRLCEMIGADARLEDDVSAALLEFDVLDG